MYVMDFFKKKFFDVGTYGESDTQKGHCPSFGEENSKFLALACLG